MSKPYDTSRPTTMTSGFHSHYCPRHERKIECAQITHCRRGDVSLCTDCIYEDWQTKQSGEKDVTNTDNKAATQ